MCWASCRSTGEPGHFGLSGPGYAYYDAIAAWYDDARSAGRMTGDSALASLLLFFYAAS